MGETPEWNPSTLVSTGVDGLDDILYGGLVPNRLHLVEGLPGSGKTTLALQFLRAGVRGGERVLFVTLSETEGELRASAASHGWSLDDIPILELIASEESLRPDARYTMFHPSEVELTETTKKVLAEAERLQPTRLVFDSLSELRLLAENPLRYRRQILALKQFFSRRQCTVIVIDDRTSEGADPHLHSIAHGVISLEGHTPSYGTTQRRLRVIKMRGRPFREGYHDYVIRRGGLVVLPRLVAAEHHHTRYARELVPSGLESLDALLGGGLSRGTSTLLMGPSGTGKSSLATQFMKAAAARGEPSVLFLFDESEATFFERSASLGQDVEALVQAGRLRLQQVDPAELLPGEFAHLVRHAVARDGVRMVLIDSLTGYLNAMPSGQYLMLHLHELLAYLGQQGVTTLFTLVQHGLVGSGTESPVDTSYLADTVLLLRYFEAGGTIRQAISVIKKRTGPHEKTIRELWFDHRGIHVGEPLREFQGVLTGVPTYLGQTLKSGKPNDEPRE